MADISESKPVLTPEAIALLRERHAQQLANSRLSLPPEGRILLATCLSTTVGFGLGASHGAQGTGLRFRAENAHRLPQTPTGWYLYHKSKNYNMALGGVREGLKMGTKMGFWVAAFFGIEYGWDEVRGKKDFVNTTMAALTVAGGFSLWNKFPVVVAAKAAKSGMLVGLAFGLAQDALGMLRGRRPGYVDFVMGTGKQVSRSSRDSTNA